MMVTSFVLTVRQKLFMTTLKLRQAMQLQCGSFQKGLILTDNPASTNKASLADLLLWKDFSYA